MRWTLALALAIAAAVALVGAFPSGFTTVSGRPTEWWNASAPPSATVAALLALLFALCAVPERPAEPTWPWSGRARPGDALSATLMILGIAAALLPVLVPPGAGAAADAVRALALPAWATLMLASSVASPRRHRWGWLWFWNAVAAWVFFLAFP